METDNRSRAIWSRLGGQLGVGLCLVGFLLVFLGWNGAASVDRVTSQFPYLLSGGVAGLCFVVLGVGMLVVQNQRSDRAALQATLRDLQDALERAGLAEGTGEQRPAFRKPEPRPEALDGARSPREEHPIETEDEASADEAPVDDGQVGDVTAEVPLPVRPVRTTPIKAAPKKATRATKAAKAAKKARSR